MDILKKVFPLSFRFTGSVANLVIGVLIYVAASTVLGIVTAFVAGVTGMLPLMDLVTELTSGLVGVYATGGIVIMFLYHFKVLKD